MKDIRSKLLYILTDILSVIVAWGIEAVCRWKLLYSFGLTYTKEWTGFQALDSHFYIKWFLWIPLLSISVFFYLGAYEKAPYLKSRVKEITQTFTQTFVLAILIFFLTLLKEYTDYWQGLMVLGLLWGWLFAIVSIFRLIVLYYYKQKMRKGDIFLNLVIVGSGDRAEQFYQELVKDYFRSGARCVGYVADHVNDVSNVPYLGTINVLPQIIEQKQVQCLVIISDNKLSSQEILGYLAAFAALNVDVLRLPEDVDYLSGNIHTEDILSVPLVQITNVGMPVWQRHTKRLADFLLAFLGLIISSPLLLYVAIRTKSSTKGSIIFRQKRVGKSGKIFKILKFRSMVVDAEVNGPQLSHEGDPRITSWGRIMRKWRLDELPQLWNILKGEMSFVGPRPERPYFVEKLAETIPYYKILFRVKPGLTSWGMVKWGYASSLPEMKERLKFDLVYLENASLLVDIKILVYTVRILFLGKGK